MAQPFQPFFGGGRPPEFVGSGESEGEVELEPCPTPMRLWLGVDKVLAELAHLRDGRYGVEEIAVEDELVDNADRDGVFGRTRFAGRSSIADDVLERRRLSSEVIVIVESGVDARDDISWRKVDGVAVGRCATVMNEPVDARLAASRGRTALALADKGVGWIFFLCDFLMTGAEGPLPLAVRAPLPSPAACAAAGVARLDGSTRASLEPFGRSPRMP